MIKISSGEFEYAIEFPHVMTQEIFDKVVRQLSEWGVMAVQEYNAERIHKQKLIDGELVEAKPAVETTVKTTVVKSV